jgi:hypothetical protein
MIWLDRHSFDCLFDRHGGMARQQFHHHAFMRGIEVLDQYVGHAEVSRERLDQLSAGIETSCRGPYADNRKFRRRAWRAAG